MTLGVVEYASSVSKTIQVKTNKQGKIKDSREKAKLQRQDQKNEKT